VYGRKPIKAQDALNAGIVDKLIDSDFLNGAVAFAKGIAGKPAPKTRERNQKLETPQDNSTILPPREAVRKKQRN
jgi:enoyl-CoA hydratase/carnithine racemase